MGKTVIYERNYDVADAASNLSNSLKNVILCYIMSKGIRMTDIAIRMGVTRANVNLMFNKRKSWGLSTIARLCDALDIEIEFRLKKRKKERHTV